MLKRLTIQNVALIDRAQFEFSEGLNVLSGETGAGKSVILDSIDFVLGAKADKTMVRRNQAECLVRAEFEGVSSSVSAVLREMDIDEEDVLIVSRKLTAEGKSSLKINGCTVTAAMLKRVSSILVDVHGQSEHFFLLKESNQLRLLDEIAGTRVAEIKSELSQLLSRRKSMLAELELLGGDDGERRRRADILSYQINEIERANVKEDEEEALLKKKELYMNAERIAGGLSSARDALFADGAGIDLVGSAHRALVSVTRYGEQYGELADRLESVSAELSDIAQSVDSLVEEIDVDESEAERMEARLDEIKSLKKKYGGSVALINEFLEKAKEELALLEDSGERREKLYASLKDLSNQIYSVCEKLASARKETANTFTKRVTEELRTLNISSARFEVEFDPFTREDTDRANENGLGGVRFLFSANAGEPLKELGKIISGGEMSRFMLSIKASLSSVNEIGTYLFDEIDAGISGTTARVVGEKFCKISKHTQIIAVSHLAQIAAFADREFLIEKKEEGNSTRTTVREVEGEARIREIARLAGGNIESEIALKHAKELLDGAKTYKNSL